MVCTGHSSKVCILEHSAPFPGVLLCPCFVWYARKRTPMPLWRIPLVSTDMLHLAVRSIHLSLGRDSSFPMSEGINR